jgi:hypothetical protein
VVTEICHILLATGRGGAGRVGRAHISREFANNVADGHLVLDHLVFALSSSDRAQILVGPCVAGNLMSFGDHSLDDSRPRCSGIINGTLVDVDTSDEKGSLCAVGLKLIQDASCVDIWAIIIGNGNSSRDFTGVDTCSTVQDIADLGTSDAGSAGSSWGLVGITCRSIFEQAVGSHAILISLSAPSGT